MCHQTRTLHNSFSAPTSRVVVWSLVYVCELQGYYFALIHNKERGIHNWNSWCTASVTVTMISVFGSNKFLKKFFRHLHKQDFWDYREVLKVLCFLRRSQNFKEIFLLVLTFLSNLWPSHNILTLACQPISF